MAYVSCLHPPGSTRHAIKLRFLEADHDALVIARANRLEIYTQEPDGLLLHHSKTLYGNISALQKIHPASSKTDQLFVVTDLSMFFTLSWDDQKQQLKTERSYHDLTEFIQRPTLGERCHIDPLNRFLTLEIHQGIINVIPIVRENKRSKSKEEVGSLGKPVTSRIPELGVRSSAFLRRCGEKDKSRLALLYEDSQERARLVIRELTYTAGLRDEPGSATFEDNPRHIKNDVELGARHIIPLSAPAFGFLVVGETTIAYCDEFHDRLNTSGLPEATIFVAWETLSADAFVLADEYGRLWKLTVELNSKHEYSGFQLVNLGSISHATTLIALDNNRLFVGAHAADSQLLDLSHNSIEPVQKLSNLAPILDFTVMDMGNRTSEAQVNEYSSGQARLVTGSGAYQDGTLCSVRSGVAVEELGNIGTMHDVIDLFALRMHASTRANNTLLASFIAHTRAFVISVGGEVEEVERLGDIDLSTATILAGNTPSGHVLHVTAAYVKVLDLKQNEVAKWTPEDAVSISSASTSNCGNQLNLLVQMSGAGLVAIRINEHQKLEIMARRQFDTSSQVACIALSSIQPDLAIVGFWQDSKVALLNFDTLNTLNTVSVEDIGLAVPRSLAVAQIFANDLPTLFIGMANGEVVSYHVDTRIESEYKLVGRKSVILGTQQARLKLLTQSDGTHQVLALCEHPSLIYGSEGRMVYSAITAEDATSVCSLDTVAFPESIAVATRDELRLAYIDKERTTHVQTLATKRTVRRLAYSSQHKAFLLGTIARTVEQGVEIVSSEFKLVDEVAFQTIGEPFVLNDDELVGACIRADVDDGTGNLVQRFVVGTQYLDTPETKTHRGRLIVFEVTEDRMLKVITETKVKGACQCLAVCQGRIIAALMKSVIVYDLVYERGGPPYLDKKASFRVSTLPIDISANDNIIAVSDLMKSATLLRLELGAGVGGNDKLEEIARHHETAWATTVTQMDKDTFMQTDAERNMIVLQRDTEAFTEQDRKRLKITSEIWLGDMVNRTRPILVQPTAEAIVVPRAFCATINGAIYLISLIKPEKQDLLMRLQDNMARLVPSLGNVPFDLYRGFKSRVRTEQEPRRFVDGELIEQFVACEPDLQAELVKDLGASVEQVQLMVENLKRLH